jgi:hypothetical protein
MPSPVTTQLTVNCKSTSNYSGDANQTTAVQFNYQNNILWATIVNNTMSTQVLSQDSTFGPVTLHAGCKVVLQNLGSSFNILFTGIITDSGSDNNFVGTKIAGFTVSV